MFTKILYDVARSSQMNILKSEWRYFTPSRNAKATNKGELVDFTHFNFKIGCHGNVP